MTTIYLASSFSKMEADTLMRCSDDERFAPLNILVAYPYVAAFLAIRDKLRVGQWQLDSGAFSAFNSGKVIDLKQYVRDCATLDYTECFALDVIGDYKGSEKNYEYMLSEGARAVVPVYHTGEPWCVLDRMIKTADKIAIGTGGTLTATGTAKRGGNLQYIEQVFARVWPARIHGFAMTRLSMLHRYPFHSVDSTTWSFQPQCYGNWTFLRSQKHIPGGRVRNFMQQVYSFQRREYRCKQLWRREMAVLQGLPAHPVKKPPRRRKAR